MMRAAFLYMMSSLQRCVLAADETSSSAMAEGPRDALVSTNPDDTRRWHVPRLA